MAVLKKSIIYKTILFLLLGLVLVVSVLVFGFFIRYGQDIPTRSELSEIRNDLASEIYSSDGELLGRYFYENRTDARLDEIPEYAIDALVATEDVRFFEHQGVDNRSLLRVLIKTLILQQKSGGGGSTISQQLIKNLYPRSDNIPVSKFKEMVAAKRLEALYSKDEILRLYLNTVPFGDNTFGLKSAADHYFNKSLELLEPQEAALLIGMLKGTGIYHPLRHPENALTRRNVVLEQMAKYGYMEASMVDSLKTLPLSLNYVPLSQHSGVAPYFREYIRTELQNWCSNHENEEGRSYDLYRDGLKIYTSLDCRLQQHAEEAMKRHMERLQKDFNAQWHGGLLWRKSPDLIRFAVEHSDRYKRLKAQKLSEKEIIAIFNKPIKQTLFSWQGEREALMSPLDSIKYNLQLLRTGVYAIHPYSGAIKVWIGGIDHKYFQFDHVLAKRQVGSTFKPFVYATALEKGIKPNDFYKNDSIVYHEYGGWTPENAGEGYGGEYSVLGALAKSVNTVTVQLALECGVTQVIEMAKKLGISAVLPEEPSIALGTAEIPLNQMVTAYAPFVNGGFSVNAYAIERIEDRNGNILFEHEKEALEPVLDEDLALEMVHMLKAVVDSGTARSLRTRYGFRFDMGGKTGTTQNGADGWFIGLTPNLITGVWVGGELPGIHFRSAYYGQGAYMALPIYAEMAKLTLKDGYQADYFSGSFKIMDLRMAQQFECALYRDKKPSDPLIENLIDVVDNIISNLKSEPKESHDSIQTNEGFFKRIGNLFRKKKR